MTMFNGIDDRVEFWIQFTLDSQSSNFSKTFSRNSIDRLEHFLSHPWHFPIFKDVGCSEILDTLPAYCKTCW